MADGAQEKSRSAGVSSDPGEVAAVFDWLKAELGRRPPTTHTDGSGQRFEARHPSEWRRPVVLDGRIERRPGPRGRLVYTVKRVLRKLMSWYVDPALTDLCRRVEESSHRLDELEERVLRLERARPGTSERRPET